MQRLVLPTPHAHAELQALKAIQPSHALLVDPPPSRRSKTQMRKNPKRGRAWASSRMRRRRAV